MATLRESYNNTGNRDDQETFYGADGTGGQANRCQTFTASDSYKMTSFGLYMCKSPSACSPGTITGSVRNTSGGSPTGADLDSGTTNGNTLPDFATFEWRYFTFSTGTNVANGTQYAMHWHAPSGDVNNKGVAGTDASSPSYAGGSGGYSSDDSAWTMTTGIDYLFEVYGDDLAGGTPSWRDPLQRIASTQRIISANSRLI